MTLDHERMVYQSHRMELLGPAGENEGKFTAIKGNEIVGPFEGYDSALQGAYDCFGIGGFLVKKIERVETVLDLTRDLR